MTQTGLSKELIIRKIKASNGKYDISTNGLIELKKAGVEDDVIELLFDKINQNIQKDSKQIEDDPSLYSDSQPVRFDSFYQTPQQKTSRIVLSPREALRNAKTIAFKKSSLHPSRQALEKELLKRKDWKELNLIIVRYKADADLLVEIGYVSMSWISHRYTYRIFDNKSGTVIVAGETTSWGSLPKNLARGIALRLSKTKKEVTK
jgi:hypothetical protein